MSGTHSRRGWPLICSCYYIILSKKPRVNSFYAGHWGWINSLCRRAWEGLFLRCTNHQGKGAGGRLPEQKQDWECMVQRTFLRKSHAVKMAEPAKNSLPLPPPTPAPKIRKQSLAEAVNQPLCPESDEWEREILVRPPRVWRPQELSEAGSSLAVKSMLPPPPPSGRPLLFECLALLCPRRALSLWFHSLSQCGWLLVGVTSLHGIGETTKV